MTKTMFFKVGFSRLIEVSLNCTPVPTDGRDMPYFLMYGLSSQIIPTFRAGVMHRSLCAFAPPAANGTPAFVFWLPAPASAFGYRQPTLRNLSFTHRAAAALLPKPKRKQPLLAEL